MKYTAMQLALIEAQREHRQFSWLPLPAGWTWKLVTP